MKHVHALGFRAVRIPLPVGIFRFVAAPTLHRSGHLGHIFVGDTDGGEPFSRADEETLIMGLVLWRSAVGAGQEDLRPRQRRCYQRQF